MLVYYENTTLEHCMFIYCLEHVSAIIFGHHQAETQVCNWKIVLWIINQLC